MHIHHVQTTYISCTNIENAKRFDVYDSFPRREIYFGSRIRTYVVPCEPCTPAPPLERVDEMAAVGVLDAPPPLISVGAGGAEGEVEIEAARLASRNSMEPSAFVNHMATARSACDLSHVLVEVDTQSSPL